MKRVVRAQEMKACDSRMIKKIGVPSLVLMERAAAETVQEILRRVTVPVKQLRVLCVCGSGNNGGDGYACGRILSIKGAKVTTVLVGNKEHVTPETKTQMDICSRLGIVSLTYSELFSQQSQYDVIIDAIFGIGLGRKVEGHYRDVIDWINAQKERSFIAAVDIPSGISADTGQVLGCAVCADLTVTMQFPKIGLILYPGASYAGEVVTAEIGIQEIASPTAVYLPEKSDFYELQHGRNEAGNKGSFGKLLIVAGSLNMSGASYLSAKAALRSGCGMVKLLTVEENRQIIQETLPEVMLSTYHTKEEAILQLDRDLNWCDAVLVGSGMGQSLRTQGIVEYLLQNAQKPMVLDADALNVLQGNAEPLRRYPKELILTPHIGEMSRLSGLSASELKADPVSHAAAFADKWQLTLIMKDAKTVTAYPNQGCYINRFGNSGMATAGSGDVLAGITASYLAQRTVGRENDPSLLPHIAVLLHALSGDAAKESEGEVCMTATDIIEGIKTVYKGKYK